MKDDCYWILDEGWKPTLTPVRDSKSKIKKGEFESDFIPFNYVIARYFKEEQNEINQTEAELERLVAEKTELQEEHAGEEDALHNVSSKADATINLKEFFNLYLDKYHPKIHLEFENARVRWFLSVNYDYIPDDVKAVGQRTYRSITVDGNEIEFSGGFTDLHTKSYEHILTGGGFGLEEARKSIEIVSDIRNQAIVTNASDVHPFVSKVTG